LLWLLNSVLVHILIRLTIKRLEVCTLWSTATFQRFSSQWQLFPLSRNNMIQPLVSIFVQQWPKVMQVAYPRRRNATDMDRPMRCSSLTLEREGHLIIKYVPVLNYPPHVNILENGGKAPCILNLCTACM
jgi:hypothetical protein